MVADSTSATAERAKELAADGKPATVRALASAAAVIAGVLLASWMMQAAATSVPNDLRRNGTVLRALASGHPEIVIFGDSRAEAGVDARQLTRQLSRSPLAYNLATHSQTLAQSFLFQQGLPSSVRVVVQFVTPENIGSDVALDTNVFNSMYLYGYRPSAESRETLGHCFGPAFATRLGQSDFAERFEGRWVLRQAIDAAVRSRLRRDLALAREEDDLFFPTAYTERMSPAKFAGELEGVKERGSGRITPCQACVIEAMMRRARSAGRRLLIVTTPVHPAARRVDLQQRLVASLRARGVEVLDLSSALGDPDFVDPLHASASGASKITSRIAAALTANH